MSINPTINRSVVMVIPQQPFYDWFNKVFPTLTPTKAKEVKEHFAYLLPDDLDFYDMKKALKKHWQNIFVDLCEGQCTDPFTWPNLSYTLFEKWFICYGSSLVQELTIDEPLYLENYERDDTEE